MSHLSNQVVCAGKVQRMCTGKACAITTSLTHWFTEQWCRG